MYLWLTFAARFIVKSREFPRRMGTSDAAHFPCLGCVPQAASHQDFSANVLSPGNLY
jgi:hypothetical protein